MYVYGLVFMNMNVSMYIYVYILYTCIYINIYMNMNIHMYIDMYIDINTYICIYTGDPWVCHLEMNKIYICEYVYIYI
jgi:hypothetical protein